MTLNCSSLKTWLHRDDFGRRDKLLIILSSFAEPCQVREIRARGDEAGLRIPRTWNVSSVLGGSNGLAIRTPKGWEIAARGQDRLNRLGVANVDPPAVEEAADLRSVLVKIDDPETREFVEEAVRCYEHELYRSAIVMSWVGAVSVLHGVVLEKHLAKFNAEASRVNSRWKSAHTKDDLARMRESDFLDRIAAVSVIGKDVKKALRECLGRRNSCGHPNSLRIAGKAVAHHVEVLLLNVFTKFQ